MILDYQLHTSILTSAQLLFQYSELPLAVQGLNITDQLSIVAPKIILYKEGPQCHMGTPVTHYKIEGEPSQTLFTFIPIPSLQVIVVAGSVLVPNVQWSLCHPVAYFCSSAMVVDIHALLVHRQNFQLKQLGLCCAMWRGQLCRKKDKIFFGPELANAEIQATPLFQPVWWSRTWCFKFCRWGDYQFRQFRRAGSERPLIARQQYIFLCVFVGVKEFIQCFELMSALLV